MGNRPEVKYALPVFMNEFLQPLLLTDRMVITFSDELPVEEELRILDSLRAADHLIRLPFNATPYLFQITKASPRDPLALVNHYRETIEAVTVADPEFAFMIDP